MTNRIYNFGAGPSMLPGPVIERIRDEMLDFQGIGASVVEISHRSKEFDTLTAGCEALIREAMDIPDNYHVLFMHGGAQMQFSAVPLNLMARKPARSALYVESGNFARIAFEEACKFGNVTKAASSKETAFDRIPALDPAALDPEASYLHITTNNTLYGTRWQEIPETGPLPLVGDATSEILSRPLDIRRFGLLYAGAQKNMGVSGLAIVIIREELLGHAPKDIPKLLNYEKAVKAGSYINTPNTFAIYVTGLMLEWLKEQGGVTAIEKVNEQKAALLYEVIDRSGFYTGVAHPEHRSTMNVTFNLPDPELLKRFLADSLAAGLYALAGHRAVGGARASIYNSMPVQGVSALISFMEEFERQNG